MRADALAAGRKLLDKESEIEQLFASGAADAARGRRLLEESADLRAELRWVHLSAHLAARDLLTSEQRALYLWLEARRTQAPFTVAPGPGSPWREELRWLGLDGDGEAASGDAPAWL